MCLPGGNEECWCAVIPASPAGVQSARLRAQALYRNEQSVLAEEKRCSPLDCQGIARLSSVRYCLSYLCDVVVDPAWQHKGVGRALLEAIQTNPLFRDLRGILVSRDAQPFYAKFGFEKSNRGMVKPAKES